MQSTKTTLRDRYESHRREVTKNSDVAPENPGGHKDESIAAPLHTPMVDQIKHALASNGRFLDQQVHVAAHEGVVTLRGTVTSYYQKQLIQEAAMRVSGVRRLNNCVEVHPDVAGDSSRS